MDAVQQFADKLNFPVPKTFVVAGASKVNKFSIFSLTFIVLYLLNYSVDGQVSYFNLFIFVFINKQFSLDNGSS